jgi:hypothetical protein
MNGARSLVKPDKIRECAPDIDPDQVILPGLAPGLVLGLVLGLVARRHRP